MRTTKVLEVTYTGGGVATAYTFDVAPLASHTQIQITGADSSTTTMEVQALGSTSWQTVAPVATPATTWVILNELITALRVTITAGGSYPIKVYQWESSLV